MARVHSPVFHQLSILRHHAPYRQQLETESSHKPHGNLIGRNGVGFARNCRDQWIHLPIFMRASMATPSKTNAFKILHDGPRG
jgi:hypothetical protein